jgi:membrane fusion protein, multidrug efflux system
MLSNKKSERLRMKDFMKNLNAKMSKQMKYMLLIVGILFGAIFAYKAFQNFMMRKMLSQGAPTITVSAMQAQLSDWEPQYKVTGSLRTIKGVNVTTELPGMIREIVFTPGAFVKQGDLLVQLDIDADVAELKSLEAKAKYAKITLDRDSAQYKFGAVSKEQVDSDVANYKSSAEQVKAQIANIAKKTIRAPFDGKLGISAVNPGEYLNAGQKVVNLQTLDPIYVDFNVPQEALARFDVGQTVSIEIDTYPNVTFSGKVTTIDPEVDKNTRNIQVEATLPNPEHKLLPGMFANVITTTGSPQKFLTLPQTAISFNSYGDIIYILSQANKDNKGNAMWKAHQRFVTTGERRGNQVAVLDGVKAGDMVVTSGQLKIKNDSIVTINNSVEPSDDPNPHPAEK